MTEPAKSAFGLLDPASRAELIAMMDAHERAELASLLEKMVSQQQIDDAKTDFLAFTKLMWPDFIDGRHHKIMAEKFQGIAEGRIKRLIINMPPRHTKSEFGSFLLPAWLMGRFPHRKVIEATHTGELALLFGRKVRNLVDSKKFQSVFPDVSLQQDSKSAGRWTTNAGGSYFAAGVGANIAGYGGDLIVIDDPHSEQDGKNLNTKSFDDAYDWYMTGPRQRLQPGGCILIIMCMTGDTRVMLADGSEKMLRNIRRGDAVATYRGGSLSTSRVVNWKSNGFDSIFKIRTSSGVIVKANERHPFLVLDNGVPKWIRVKDLRTGQKALRVSGENGRVRPACLTDVGRKSTAGAIALRTTTKFSGQTASGIHPEAQKNGAMPDSNSITESPEKNTTTSLQSRAEIAPSAASRPEKMSGRTGAENYASIIATTPEKSGGFCATTATSSSAMQERQKSQWPQPNTSDFTPDEIVEILPAGIEEVFDVQIDETENFIANGLVSHNTRWGKKDLTGRLLDYAAKNPGSDQWEVIEFPAIMPSGKQLWPEFWPLEELLKTKEALHPRFWSAQYQQDPTSAESAIIKREWWKVWPDDDPPPVEYMIQSWDTAFTKNDRSDYSACTTWGVFYKDDDKKTGKLLPNIILLDSFKEKLEFPELKDVAFKHYKEFNPDTLIVEAKASGHSLIQELRQMGIPVQEFVPSKGSDKIARLNSITDLFASGVVWYPETRWAQELIEETADFPNGEHDDLVDSMTCALIRYRQGGFVRLPSDDWEEPKPRRQRGFY